MTHDGDILAKFKLLSETTIQDTTSSKAQEKKSLDIFDGFLGDMGDGDVDLFSAFVRKVAKSQAERNQQLAKLYEQASQDSGKGQESHKQAEQKSKKLNFLLKAINKLFNKTQTEVSQQAGKFVSKDDEKDSTSRKPSFSSFNTKYSPDDAYLLNSPALEYKGPQRKTSQDGSLISKVAKISVNYNTDNMEDIIKSEELSNNELFELFVNYVKKSEQENPGSSKVLDEVLAKANYAGTGNVSPEKVERAKLENIFIDFINETSKDGQSSPLDISVDKVKPEDTTSQVVLQFAAAINPEYMTRDELEELFVRFCRLLSTNNPDGFKQLSDILSSALAIAFVPDDGSAMRNAQVVDSFRSAINPEFMTREELEELFIRFVRELSTNAPDAWAEMAGVLSNATAFAFSPDISMDDQSRAAIANFRMAISPERMTRETLEELFTRFSREVSAKFPAAWAELMQILNNALPNAFAPDTTMDPESRAAIAGFAQAINPESMTREELEEIFVRFARAVSVRFPAAWAELQGMLSVAISNSFVPDMTMDPASRAAIAGFAQAIKPEIMTRATLEELFTRFSREVSVKFPAAWAELQGMLAIAIANSFVPDMTMDDDSRSAIAGFELAICPEYMKRDQLEELFTRFAREVSVQFPAALQILSGILAQALPNAYVEPIPEMDNYSVSVINSFQGAIKPDSMTREQLEKVFAKFVGEISSQFPAAHQLIRSYLSVALANAFIPDLTMDDASSSAIAGFAQAIKPEYMTRDTLEEIFIRYSRQVSAKFPAAWAELQGMLSVAVAGCFIPDLTMDDASRSAISGFAQAVKPEIMTRDTLEELFLRFAREVSVAFPAAWAEMQGMLSVALSNCFVPDTTMDDASRSAIAGFELAICPESMKRDQLEELFTRFAREVSIQFPAALHILSGILAQALPNAYVEPIPEMDNYSVAVINSFQGAIKPDSMTREQLEKVFAKFVGEISSQFPAAHQLIRSHLQVALANAFIPDETMDDASRSAIAGFSQAIKPEYMTRETLEELFTRFSREVSVKFPAAWAELQGMLSVAVAGCFIPDLSMDDASRSAIAGFSQAIKPEYMTRETLEELFLRFSREVSVAFPAAWAELQGMLAAAVSTCFIPDTTMDEPSRAAIAGFSQAIKPEYMTRDELEELFTRFAREVSVAFPAAWAELQGMLNQSVSKCFVPDTTMDDDSRSAIANFQQAIKPEIMTRDTLEELFTRYVRKVSIRFPAAWGEMQGMLSVAVSNCFVPDNTMDDDSRSAIANFQQAIKPEIMTRDTLEELFTRYVRKVSIKFPAAWGEMQGMLSVAVSNCFVPDTTMDEPSRAAIAGFAQVIKPEYMTRDELEELFVRFSREISIAFPAAWAELQGTLNSALPRAFVPDTTMDEPSRAAIAGLEQAIKPEIMTRVELETLFLRFSREISIKFPVAWSQLQGILNDALPHAFVPDLTKDDDTKSLMDEFQSIIESREFTEKELEEVFADYLRQVPLRFPVVKSVLEYTTKSKRGEAVSKDKREKKMQKEAHQIKKDFKEITEVSNALNLKAQIISKDLKFATNKEEIKEITDRLRKIEGEKSSLDKNYSTSKVDIDGNAKAVNNLGDDYVQELDLSFDKKDDRQLFEIQTNKLTNWDMLRTLRRGEVLDAMYELPKDELAECLYVIPKYLLKQALIQLPVEDMCRVLFNARFPEALLRAMPRNKAIELLPTADQMLPILMNMGHISGFKNGCDLIENVMINTLKVEPEQNPTRTQEEILPFVEEQLIGKTPRLADAMRPVQGKQSPINVALSDIEADPESLQHQFDADDKMDKVTELEKQKLEESLKGDNIDSYAKDKKIDADQELLKRQFKTDGKFDDKQKLELKYKRPESLDPEKLEMLAQDTIKNFTKEEGQEVLGAKRGTPAQMIMFLDSMRKVKDLAGAKMAVSVLSVAQQKAVAKATLPQLETKHLVKISQYYGKSSKDMVKAMPRYAIEGLVKALPKHYMIQGFKLLDKSMIIGMMKTQSSQTIARVASESLSREKVKDTAFKKQGFV